MSVSLLDLLAWLNSWFLLLINWTRLLLSHGRLRLVGNVFWGIHSRITSKNLFCQLVHDSSTSSVIKDCQSVASSRSLALSQSALLYLQTVLPVLFCARCECFHCDLSRRPRWSEFDNGGIVWQDRSRDGENIATRSIMVSVPLGQMWVGSETTCDKQNELKILHNLL